MVVGVRPVTDTVKVVDRRRRRRDRRPRRAGRRRLARRAARRAWSPPSTDCRAPTSSSSSPRCAPLPGRAGRGAALGPPGRLGRGRAGAGGAHDGSQLERQVQVLGKRDLEVARGCSARPPPAGRRSGPSRRRCRCPRSRPRRRRCRPPAGPRRGTPAGSARRRAPGGRSRPSRASRPGSRTTGIAPPVSRAAAIVAAKSSGPASGRAPSWIATTSTSPASISGASARSAAHSEACRVVAALDQADLVRRRGAAASAAATSSCSPGRTTTSTRRTSPSAARASRTDQASTGRSPSGSSTLLEPAPTREPVPAARITTAAGTRGVYEWTVRECFHGCYTAKQVLDAPPLRSRRPGKGHSDDACR